MGIRSTYDGPLSMATDYMVWNVTKDNIRTRMVEVNPDVWPPPAAYPKPEIDQSGMMFISPEVAAGKLREAQDIDDTIFDRINAIKRRNSLLSCDYVLFQRLAGTPSPGLRIRRSQVRVLPGAPEFSLVRPL